MGLRSVRAQGVGVLGLGVEEVCVLKLRRFHGAEPEVKDLLPGAFERIG